MVTRKSAFNVLLATIVFVGATVNVRAQKRGRMPSAEPAGRAGKSSASVAQGVGVGDTAPSSAAPSGNNTVNAASAQAAPDVKESDPVITLQGLCPATSDNTDQQACTKNITRDEFEDILSAVSLNGQAFAPGAVRNVADTYVQNLVLANAALKKGLDKNPNIQKLLELVRLRTLAEAYRHSAEERYREPSQQEIEKYYHDNIAYYETVKAERFFVPKFNPKSPKEGTAEFEKKAQALASELRGRALNGEPLDKLQNEAFLKLGIPAPAFLPETGLRRRASYAADVAAEIFSLKPGQVTPVKAEAGGFAFYRLQQRDMYTLEQVKGEIVRDIFRQKMEADVKGVLSSVRSDFNSHYFAPSPTQRSTVSLDSPAGTKTSASPRVQSTHSMKLPKSSSGKAKM